MGALNPLAVTVMGVVYGVLKYLAEEAALAAFPWCDHPTRCFNFADELAASLSRDVDPCDNLFEHVCAKWDRNHPLQPSGQFSVLQGRVSVLLFGVLERPAGASLRPAAVRRSVLAYQACRAVHDQRRNDAKVLYDVFKKFNFEWPSLSLPGNFDAMDFLLGFALDYGLATPFDFTLQPYLKTDKRYGLSLEISGIYDNATFEERVLTTCLPAIAPSTKRSTILKAAERIRRTYIEWASILIASLSGSRPTRSYSTVESLANDTAPSANLSDWLRVVNKHLPQDLSVGKDENVLTLGNSSTLLRELLRATKSSDYVDLALFGGWQVVLQVYTGASYPLMECFNPSQTVIRSALGCQGLVNEVAAYALSRLLADELRLSEAVSATEKIWMAVSTSTESNFANLSWMDSSTAAGAAAHVKSLISVVSLPEHLRNDEALEAFHDYLPEFSQPFLTSLLDARRRRSEKYKRLLKPNASYAVHREDITLDMINVNAYYVPVNHLMVVPSAIIAPPFLMKGVPEAVNYGAIGKVLGHEMTHSFDPLLSNKSRTGDEITWWSPAPYETFIQKYNCVIAQLETLTKSRIQAVATVAEAFADTAGTEKAHLAYRTLPLQPSLLGYTQEQLFFVASCFGFCGPSAYRYRSPPGLYPAVALRCNLPVANQQRFAAAFQCPSGASLNPRERCTFH